jgi:hypothetical protein
MVVRSTAQYMVMMKAGARTDLLVAVYLFV